MDTQEKYILTINTGSSSIKFAVFVADLLAKVFEGKVDRLMMEGTTIEWTDVRTGEQGKNPIEGSHAVTRILEVLSQHISPEAISTIGYRIVHGGTLYHAPTQVDTNMITELEKFSHIAPQHLPAQIAVLKAFTEHFQSVLHYACFDTSFYHTLPRVAQIIPLPHKYETQNVRKYGFHGLSYEYLMQNLEEVLHEPVSNQKIILAHLGNGASLTAVMNGTAVDTSMGFSPTSGIPMGTRSGDLDPGLFEYFTKSLNFTPEMFNHMVNFESGMLGISGSTADMEKLLERANEDTRAEDAVSVFCYHVRKCIGSLAAAMDGVDVIVFTGGIGEKSAEIRARILSHLSYLGVQLDTPANDTNNTRLSNPESQVILYVIPTDEERILAQHTKELHTSVTG